MDTSQGDDGCDEGEDYDTMVRVIRAHDQPEKLDLEVENEHRRANKQNWSCGHACL